MLMAIAMLASSVCNIGMTVAAAENETVMETETELETQLETEKFMYEVILPNVERIGYEYQSGRQVAGSGDREDIVLNYEAGESVEVTVFADTDYQIDDVKVQDLDSKNMDFDMDDNGNVQFTMPEKNVKPWEIYGIRDSQRSGICNRY